MSYCKSFYKPVFINWYSAGAARCVVTNRVVYSERVSMVINKGSSLRSLGLVNIIIFKTSSRNLLLHLATRTRSYLCTGTYFLCFKFIRIIVVRTRSGVDVWDTVVRTA